MVDTEQQRPQLRVLSGGQETASSTLDVDVRNARRDLGQLLRALQAAGHAVTRWESDTVTRLAHFDSVTARFLLDGRGEPDEVRRALTGLRTIERWIDNGLPTEERAEVRTFELLIRIEDAELHEPLLRPHHAPEEHSPAMCEQELVALRSLRSGLRGLIDTDLAELGKRLGIAPLGGDDITPEQRREHQTDSIVQTLRDDHLLAILLTTLDGQTQRVLFELVGGELTPDELGDIAKPMPVALVVGGSPVRAENPIEALRACGLVYGAGQSAWVPVELHPRIDGVLQALGL